MMEPSDLGLFQECSIELKLAVITEARNLFGPKIGREVWHQLGFPNFVNFTVSRAFDTPLAKQVSSFVGSCLVNEPGASTGAAELYAAFSRWCDCYGHPVASQTAFGRTLTRLSVKRRVSHRASYLDVRLVTPFPDEGKEQ